MQAVFGNLKIKGIATAYPKNILEMSSLGTQFGENNVARIIESTGIHSVRIAQKEVKTSDLCFVSAKQLFTSLDVSPASIDGLVFVSQTPDAIMPATSVILQNRLGLGTNVAAFDINYGCSGYVYGLYQASMMITSGGCKRVLICTGDVISTLLRADDKNVRMIFGDAGSATLLEKGDHEIAFNIKTDGSGKDFLKTVEYKFGQSELSGINSVGECRPYLFMDGSAVMEFALSEVPDSVSKLLSMKGWTKDDVGVYAFHQANHFMLNYLRKKMRLDRNKVPIAVETTGNTGSASIPLMLSLKYRELNEASNLEKVVMCGFGVGLSVASAGLNLSNTKIFDPIEY